MCVFYEYNSYYIWNREPMNLLTYIIWQLHFVTFCNHPAYMLAGGWVGYVNVIGWKEVATKLLDKKITLHIKH